MIVIFFTLICSLLYAESKYVIIYRVSYLKKVRFFSLSATASIQLNCPEISDKQY